MKCASVPSAYRNCIFRASVRTARNFSPARNVRSITAPSDARRSFERTNAPPLPGLTCWNSRILKTVPSTSMWFPFLNWFVLIMAGRAQGTSTRGRYIPTLEPPARCRYVGRERPRRLLDAGTGARPAPAPAERRAACTPDGGGQRPGVRGPVRAPSPGALPLLPDDRPPRRGRRGRAADDDGAGAGGPRPRRAGRADSPVAVPDRSQRGDLAPAPTPLDGRARAGAGARGPEPGGPRGGAPPARDARGGPGRAARTAAQRARHARAERSVARGDRRRPRDLGRRRQAGHLRRAHGPSGVREGTRDGVR